MVAGLVCPLAKEVVGYQVDDVEVLGRPPQVDVLEEKFRGGQGGREQVAVLGKMKANRREQGEKIVPLLWGARVFPDNWIPLAAVPPYGRHRDQWLTRGHWPPAIGQWGSRLRHDRQQNEIREMA